MSAREVAEIVVRMRALLNAGMIAELKGDDDEHARLLFDFEQLAAALPLRVVWGGGIARRVIDPARRKVDREGILAQSPDSQHVHLMIMVSVGVWRCSDESCPFEYGSKQ